MKARISVSKAFRIFTDAFSSKLHTEWTSLHIERSPHYNRECTMRCDIQTHYCETYRPSDAPECGIHPRQCSHPRGYKHTETTSTASPSTHTHTHTHTDTPNHVHKQPHTSIHSCTDTSPPEEPFLHFRTDNKFVNASSLSGPSTGQS